MERCGLASYVRIMDVTSMNMYAWSTGTLGESLEEQNGIRYERIEVLSTSKPHKAVRSLSPKVSIDFAVAGVEVRCGARMSASF